MQRLWDAIQIALAALGAFFGWLWGGLDGLMYVLLSFIVIDYLTGVMRAAIIDKKLSSEIGAKGIAKKVLILALVGVGHLLDIYLLGKGSTLRSSICLFYLSNEGLSILENTVAIGLPVPDKLKEILAQLTKKDK